MIKEPLITWGSKTFELGIESIDSQHKKLVDYINELDRAIDIGQEKDTISALFEKLYNYTRFHFKEEEAYFFNLSKNDFLLHQLQHKHFIEELDRIIALEKIESISAELLYFLTDWLLNHIQVEDRKFIQQHQH
jgi:hemerythrin